MGKCRKGYVGVEWVAYFGCEWFLRGRVDESRYFDHGGNGIFVVSQPLQFLSLVCFIYDLQCLKMLLAFGS